MGKAACRAACLLGQQGQGGRGRRGARDRLRAVGGPWVGRGPWVRVEKGTWARGAGGAWSGVGKGRMHGQKARVDRTSSSTRAPRPFSSSAQRFTSAARLMSSFRWWGSPVPWPRVVTKTGLPLALIFAASTAPIPRAAPVTSVTGGPGAVAAATEERPAEGTARAMWRCRRTTRCAASRRGLAWLLLLRDWAGNARRGGRNARAKTSQWGSAGESRPSTRALPRQRPPSPWHR